MWKCTKCNKTWHYNNIEKCIFCSSPLAEIQSKKYKVKGSTEIFIPSPDHRDIPYIDLLLEDESGNSLIKKTHQQYKLGEEYRQIKTELVKIKLGVVGAGVMGSGIAQLFASLGHHQVIVVDIKKEALEASQEKITRSLKKVLDNSQTTDILNNITFTTNLKKLKNVNLIIECVLENEGLKKKIFQDLDKIVSDKTILASNTSSLLIKNFTKNVSHPERVLGIHFFNPVDKMKLVEVVKTDKTSKSVLDFIVKILFQTNKIPIIVKDTPCFIVNRVLMPFLNEAVLLVENSIASPESVDQAIKLGLNHPLGPLSLLDLIGLDVFIEIMNNLYKETGDQKYIPSKLAIKMVKQGKLGRKSGEGFFKY